MSSLPADIRDRTDAWTQAWLQDVGSTTAGDAHHAEAVSLALHRYLDLGGERDAFALGAFLTHGLRLVELGSVGIEHRAAVTATKHLFILWNAWLDDVVDTRRDADLAERLLEVPYRRPDPSGLDPARKAWLDACSDGWALVDRRVRALPRYRELASSLAFDVRQFLMSLRYSLMIAERPEALCPLEHETCAGHNMNIVVFATMDLMASPGFDIAELPWVRTAAHHAQAMGRLSNDLCTWRGEAKDRDFANSLFAHAVAEGVVHPRDLGPEGVHTSELIRRIEDGGIEERVMERRAHHRGAMLDVALKARTVDVAAWVAGLDGLHVLYGQSRAAVDQKRRPT
ncbi:MAG: hypothetical protein H6736_17455 [Alphaproteobacteria bacterium]|nr:hypothetical protein [Alphaproteobacteria bacterium]MCB9693602.1 hypothetical protein [Alphaproteobacteria bacterium]